MKRKCSGLILDIEGELVCSTCGAVRGYVNEETPNMESHARLDYSGKLVTHSLQK